MSESEPVSHPDLPAKRLRVELHSAVIITASGNPRKGEAKYSFFSADTYDLSSSGLALLMSEADVQDLCSLGTEPEMKFTLPTFVGSVEMEAMPVRYELLESGRYLVGARISNLDDHNRELYDFFLETIASGNHRELSHS